MADGGQVWRDPDIGNVRTLLAQLRPRDSDVKQSWAERRAGMDAFAALGGLPEGCTFEQTTAAGRPAERLTPQGADTTRVLLYLHGGGYCVGSPLSHRALAGWLASSAGISALVPDYRMGPENPFPAAVDDALAVYRELLDGGVAPANVIIAGDSAGGGLTAATGLAIKQAGLPQPAGLFCISPWANLAQVGAAYDRLADVDPMLTKDGLDEFAAAYLAGQDAANPLASPVLGDFTGVAPMLIHAGGAEILLSDAAALAEKAGLDGVDVRLEIWPEMIHVWHAFSGQLGAGKRAIAVAGEWMRGKLAPQA